MIFLRTTFVGLCVSLDTFSTTVGDSSQLLLASYTPGLIHFKTFGILSSWAINTEPCILIKFFKQEAHAQSPCNKYLAVGCIV